MKKSISGIRGIVGKDLTLKDVLHFCERFSSLINSKKCVIGMDTRPSSHIIKEVVCSSLLQCGIDVFDLGMIPTPVIFRESRKYGSGVIITSSHNPIEWNGLKFIIDGKGLNQNQLNVLLSEKTVSKTKIGVETKIDSDYVNEAANLIGKVKGNPKIVVDVGGGAAKKIAPELLKKIYCQVQVINENFNEERSPDPTVDKLSDLVKTANGNDIGFAFDLDGDRLVVVKDGKKLPPDVTLGLGVAKALEFGYKKFVISIDTSVSIEKFILEKGGTVERSKVGEANVIELMIKTHAQAGGEGSSGGFILPEFNFCREGILTSGLIASILHTSTLDEVLKFMNNFSQRRTKVSIPSEFHDKVIKKLSEKMKELGKVVEIDGLKAIIDDNSWVLVRKSNTEDTIRISSESNDIQKVQEIEQRVLELVKKSYEQVK